LDIVAGRFSTATPEARESPGSSKAAAVGRDDRGLNRFIDAWAALDVGAAMACLAPNIVYIYQPLEPVVASAGRYRHGEQRANLSRRRSRGTEQGLEARSRADNESALGRQRLFARRSRQRQW